MPDRVPDVLKAPGSLDQQADDTLVARECRLMERRGVTVIAVGIVPVRILARVEEQPDDLGVAHLRRERDRPMAIQRIRLRKKTGRIGKTSQSGSSCHRRNPRAAANQRFGGVE